MSIAAIDRLEGLVDLLATSGETVTFRDEDITCLIERNMGASPLRTRQIEFTERPMTRIEVLRTSITSAPLAGETFLDAAGEFHRVKTVRSTDLTYRCDCELAGPED